MRIPTAGGNVCGNFPESLKRKQTGGFLGRMRRQFVRGCLSFVGWPCPIQAVVS